MSPQVLLHATRLKGILMLQAHSRIVLNASVVLNDTVGVRKSRLATEVMAALHHRLAVINRTATSDVTSVIDSLRHPAADMATLNVATAKPATQVTAAESTSAEPTATDMTAAESASTHMAAAESSTAHVATAESAPHVAATTAVAASAVIRINDRLTDQGGTEQYNDAKSDFASHDRSPLGGVSEKQCCISRGYRMQRQGVA